MAAAADVAARAHARLAQAVAGARQAGASWRHIGVAAGVPYQTLHRQAATRTGVRRPPSAANEMVKPHHTVRSRYMYVTLVEEGGRMPKRAQSIFWDDVERQLEDPEFRRHFVLEQNRIETVDRVMNFL